MPHSKPEPAMLDLRATPSKPWKSRQPDGGSVDPNVDLPWRRGPARSRRSEESDRRSQEFPVLPEPDASPYRAHERRRGRSASAPRVGNALTAFAGSSDSIVACAVDGEPALPTPRFRFAWPSRLRISRSATAPSRSPRRRGRYGAQPGALPVPASWACRRR